ncbi:MAG: FixH family protein [Bdellovibrionales bacterium]
MTKWLFLFLILCGCGRKYIQSENGLGGGRGKATNEAWTCDAKWSGDERCLTLTWEVPPAEKQMAAFLIKLWRPNRADQTGVLLDDFQDLKIELYMPSMGHGSSPVQIEKIDVGTYRVTAVSLFMHGDWEIRFEATDRQGQRQNAKISLDF